MERNNGKEVNKSFWRVATLAAGLGLAAIVAGCGEGSGGTPGQKLHQLKALSHV